MSKIGRNEPCFCGSGKKYKKCCYGKQPVAAPKPVTPSEEQPSLQLSLRDEITKAQETALQKKNSLRPLGVFIFVTTDEGDGWMFEITAMDALQIAQGGEKIDVEIEEDGETIEINWSHKFAFKNKNLVVTSYKEKEETVLENYPANRIKNTLIKERSKIPADMLEQLHIDDEDDDKQE